MSSKYQNLDPDLQMALKTYGQGLFLTGSDSRLLETWSEYNECCEVCSLKGKLLNCEYCNSSFHPECLNPALKTIPKVCHFYDTY